jgi:hypothetical protein
MSENTAAVGSGSVGRHENFASEISGVPLKFLRTSRDVLTSECGRYNVVRWDIGHGDFVFDANAVADGRETLIAFEASAGDAKHACEIHAGRLKKGNLQ